MDKLSKTARFRCCLTSVHTNIGYNRITTLGQKGPSPGRGSRFTEDSDAAAPSPLRLGRWSPFSPVMNGAQSGLWTGPTGRQTPLSFCGVAPALSFDGRHTQPHRQTGPGDGDCLMDVLGPGYICQPVGEMMTGYDETAGSSQCDRATVVALV